MHMTVLYAAKINQRKNLHGNKITKFNSCKNKLVVRQQFIAINSRESYALEIFLTKFTLDAITII